MSNVQLAPATSSFLVSQSVVAGATTFSATTHESRVHSEMVTPALPIIAPRSFNSLAFTETTVTKASTSAAIRGELHFYLNVPPALDYLFPTLVSHTTNPVTFTIERVDGVTLSTLLTSGRMTIHHVEMTLKNLHTMHSLKPHAHTPLFYSNHASKVRARFVKHEHSVYAQVGLTAGNHFDSLLRRLDCYEKNERAVPTSVIHGDPVLTNVIWEGHSGNLKFIDMRGAHANVLTIAGDAVYDLAKLFQSLLGYDFILADRALTEDVVSELCVLLKMYWRLVGKLYPDVDSKDIVTVCCGLWSSLIPLHDNGNHQRKFAIVSRVLLQALDNGLTNDWSHLLKRIARQLAHASFSA